MAIRMPLEREPKERHVNSLIHSIMQYIKNLDRNVPFEEIQRMTMIELEGDRKLIEALQKNKRVQVGKNFLRYKPQYNIREEKDLETLMKNTKCRNGVSVTRLTDSPVNVRALIDSLVEKKIVYILKDSDGSEILFYNKVVVQPADEKIKALWSEISVPNYPDILKELNQAGIKVEQKFFDDKKNIVKKKPKVKKFKRKIKITNTHVKGLNLNDMDL
ncbi:Transcription initiation factor IIE, beta subunit [Pseudoloma neurophilia]|uniref:Transcription initiation factor IIE, beta subunit n=1 Tax=Pseudoloma neurophilia TaxID=146866 RepID=A0A0R0LWJ5_9MICR|nr:Transcription initiation factor IIE, beta subunit [Pseudoloma neurophilia]